MYCRQPYSVTYFARKLNKSLQTFDIIVSVIFKFPFGGGCELQPGKPPTPTSQVGGGASCHRF